MSLYLIILLFIIGLVLIIKGGDYFVDAATWIAEISGIPTFIIGATIVSMATTLPELLVSAMGAYQKDASGIAIATGNAVGSVTANTGLILAISLICIPAVVKRTQYAFKAILLILSVAALWLFSFGGVFPNNYLTYIGSAVLLVLFIVFIIENIKSAKNEADTEKQDVPHTKKDITVNILKFIFGIAGIVIGARLLVDNATEIAVALKVRPAVISATIVAIGTSLPELVTTITAVVKKQSALSVGNIIGANIIDITIILPICSLLAGQPLPVSEQNILLDMPFCLIVVLIAVVPMLIKGKFTRLQGILLLASYLCYVVLITVPSLLNGVLNIFA